MSCISTESKQKKQTEETTSNLQGEIELKIQADTTGVDTITSKLKEVDTDTITIIEKRVYKNSDLVPMQEISNNFDYDIRYATANNTFKTKLYPCSACLLRYEVALAVLKANEIFMKKGYHIKFFDCYRPLSVSKKMWSIIPNPSYVKNPNRGPSMHNRGVAVDLTLVDAFGQELDMGTDFDYFGRKAHQTFTDLPANVLANRKLLRETMQKVGFRSIRTEWWHYSYRKAYPALDKPLPCNN